MSQPKASPVFSPRQQETAAALLERLFPADDGLPGATEIGVLKYLENALTGYARDDVPAYQQGLDSLDKAAMDQTGLHFAACSDAQQDTLLKALEADELDGFRHPTGPEFMEMAIGHMREGLFSDPVHGGNRDKLGWKTLGHPGVWLSNSPEEMLATEPVTKGGRFQSLEDLKGIEFTRPDEQPPVPPQFDPDAGLNPPNGEADVILIGMGMMNSVVAPLFAEAGLKVVALEAGPYLSRRDYLPDELQQAYYARAGLGPKFNSESPRWRRNEGEPTQPVTYSLGRMVNGVGGSSYHYGTWLRRFHPHHFRLRSRIRENGWNHLVPDNSPVADWPFTYEDLEPYYSRLEWDIGISGVSHLPDIPRSRTLPNPPMLPFRYGEVFQEATERMGLRPYPVPSGINTVPYRGRPATTYSGWICGFGTFDDSVWMPATECVPRALETGNLELKARCRALRILADDSGHACGVEYFAPDGQVHVQRGRCLILGTYLWENLRLLFLSHDDRHPGGLGNNREQLGRNVMTKSFAHVLAMFPDQVFNRHAGFAPQSLILDDFLYDEFDAEANGFIGGATISAEPNVNPLAISKEALPPDMSAWGARYKEHIRNWQHQGVLRIQPETLPYTSNFVDLDPRYREKSGLGLPVLRITYDMRENENKLAQWMEDKCEEILLEMGGQNPWRGPRFTGVGSCHDLGGIRAGEDPAASVVDPNLEVHDTPGLFVFSGGVFPSCPGINPSLTMMAMCTRAAENIIQRLAHNDIG